MSQKPCAKSTSPEPAKQKLARGPTPATPATRAEPPDTFQVVIQCMSEEQQEQLYDEFRSRNLTVRLLTM
jgi:hypothetical protein